MRGDIIARIAHWLANEVEINSFIDLIEKKSKLKKNELLSTK